MGICYGKNFPIEEPEQDGAAVVCNDNKKTERAGRNISSNFKAASVSGGDKLAFRAASSALFQAPPFRQAASLSFYSAAILTPECSFKQSLPPPSPAKASQEDVEKEKPSPLDGNQLEKPKKKSFGYPKNFSSKYELQQEIGRGHFGHTMVAKLKKGSLKGLLAAVKIIPKSKMETNVAIEDVKREVKILKALTGHHNLVQFYDACEDNLNVYIITELCEGGELLHRILSRGGKYPEEDAKTLVAQILDTVAFCHLQGVVHRDLKPENFLFKNKDEKSELKAIDFGLSDFIRPDERLNDIVGSPYYVAPEVLERSYSTEADVWSIGVITYVLLCGNRPFWARTESGIFGAVLTLEPNFEDTPWPSISSEAKDFVKRLLNKDQHKRMTAAQALSHPWICGIREIPLDILVYRLVKSYLQSSNLRKSALKALSKTLNEDDMIYLRAQFKILDPQNGNQISLENFRLALTRNATEAMKESRMIDILAFMEALESRKIDFEEFCAAAISVTQLQGREHWEQQVLNAYEGFEKAGNRSVAIEELAQELGIPPACVVLEDWVRPNDGRISFSGFTNLLSGNPLLTLPLDSPLD